MSERWNISAIISYLCLWKQSNLSKHLICVSFNLQKQMDHQGLFKAIGY